METLMDDNGIKIVDLLDWLTRFVETTEMGEWDECKVWVGDGHGRSNEVVEVYTLNKNDVLLEIRLCD